MMKQLWMSNFLSFVVKCLHNDRGSLSLTGGDGGEPAPDGAGDPGVSAEGAAESAEGVVNDDPAGGGSDGGGVLSGLPEEVAADPSLKVFMDDKGNVNLANLAKSYVHAQKKMGEKGVKLPTDQSPAEEWENFYNMLRPQELEQYEVQNKLGDNQVLDEELFNSFKATAHKNGLSSKQAQEIVDWFNGVSSQSQQALTEQQTAAYEKEVKGLKEEWGEGFDKEIKLASRGLKEFASEEELKYLKESGLDGNVTLIKLFNKIGKGLLEDSFKQESFGHFGMTPQEAQQKMAAVYGDKSHPYWDKTHAQHQYAVEEMQKLTEASMRSN